MSEQDLELQVFRTAIGIEQRELRLEAEAVIKAEIDNVDIDKIVMSRKNAQAEIKAFIGWLDYTERYSDNPPPESAKRLVKWLGRNQSLAFEAYNPYLIKIAVSTANKVEAMGFSKRIKELSNNLAEISKYWLEKWQNGGKK